MYFLFSCKSLDFTITTQQSVFTERKVRCVLKDIQSNEIKDTNTKVSMARIQTVSCTVTIIMLPLLSSSLYRRRKSPTEPSTIFARSSNVHQTRNGHINCFQICDQIFKSHHMCLAKTLSDHFTSFTSNLFSKLVSLSP